MRDRDYGDDYGYYGYGGDYGDDYGYYGYGYGGDYGYGGGYGYGGDYGYGYNGGSDHQDIILQMYQKWERSQETRTDDSMLPNADKIYHYNDHILLNGDVIIESEWITSDGSAN